MDVSVIIPTYGDSQYLPLALLSVAAQTTDADVEAIVIDSNPGGVEWLSRLADGCDWIVHDRQPADGVSTARNRGIELAEGDNIAFLDADDYWLPSKLDRQLAAREAGADLVYSDQFVTDMEEQA